MKRIERDGKFYRLRRGKLVEIPAEWVGEVTSRQSIRSRPSKQIGKVAREVKYDYNHNVKDREIEIADEFAAQDLRDMHRKRF
ncbi:hypothetical protein [Noviherbaspirillum aridicola]|uniref:Uncharacterized protein n=1 Tax=Noviherbaspirillum aridicola TaxID=2849687 RepID=A0ABQ4Q211_9BURK|nr:hypothetical protein [Noviherbaspirillum aridicola]GIZ51081.1 hypothetical protein NCCP691_10950 [Noviherbaspirillum aridicola]